MKHLYTASGVNVLVRRITSLARPSVCPSVPFGLLSRRQKGIKTKFSANVAPQGAGVTGLTIFSSKKFTVQVEALQRSSSSV